MLLHGINLSIVFVVFISQALKWYSLHIHILATDKTYSLFIGSNPTSSQGHEYPWKESS